MGDQPSFLSLFEQAEKILPEEFAGKFDLNLYSTAAYIIIIVAAIVVVVSFFGCYGAFRESKCMLGTYFVFILGLFRDGGGSSAGIYRELRGEHGETADD